MSPTLLAETSELAMERMSRIPEKYNPVDISQNITAPEISFREVSSDIIGSKPLILSRFPVKTKRYCTAKPIRVKVYRDDDIFFAENETISVWGAGETQQEAIEDFCEQVLYFFEHYKKIEKSKLSELALKLKEIYKDLLFEEEHAG